MSMWEEKLNKNFIKIVDISNKKLYNEYTIRDKTIYQKRWSTQARVGIKKDGVPKPEWESKKMEYPS